ncbi:hypothetical protein L2E82_45848 [Cichorium intybus]|uniref:Uncharacterized protein n=1 Tax=Cichorium intybus TaxID=13427 RepID=A0ACB8ZV20_CICIN|nr:hypothetical protein L2E82_45848 [Cichorium intybus]
MRLEKTTKRRLEKDNSLGSSLDWKPVKWICSGSLSSRGSGFSHQSSCKIIGVDPLDTKSDAQQGNSTSGDVGSGFSHQSSCKIIGVDPLDTNIVDASRAVWDALAVTGDEYGKTAVTWEDA